ncbi:hypothetical protein [Deinococcus ruber]|uniref:hypothetical protein n=1 Tax=Deinococcus ruber TaxID=1848197 RepID=UPI00166B2B00|nr:hypothetical protein [Deinococcus ruber]
MSGNPLNAHTFGSGTGLRITLARDIAENLRTKHLKPVDLDFMLSLPSNQAGILYRLLDTLFFSDPEAQRTQVLTMKLVDWGKLLRLIDLSPDRIRRAIEPPHRELIKREFLRKVEYEGRGKTQTVIYTFHAQRPDHPLTPEQLLLIGRIKNMGVTDGVAKKFVRASPVAFVENRVALAEAILRHTTSFRRSKGAYAWDILSDTEARYVAPDSERLHSVSLPSIQALKPPVLPYENDQGLLLQLSPAEERTHARPALRLLLKGHLKDTEFLRLEQLCLLGKVSATQLVRDVTSAAAKKQPLKALAHLLEDLQTGNAP